MSCARFFHHTIKVRLIEITLVLMVVVVAHQLDPRADGLVAAPRAAVQSDARPLALVVVRQLALAETDGVSALVVRVEGFGVAPRAAVQSEARLLALVVVRQLALAETEVP